MNAPGSRDPEAMAADSRRVIDDEHRQLRKLLATIDETADAVAMVPLLRELQALLVEHFEHEDSEGGLPIMVAGRAPHLMPALDGLKHEHEVFLTDVTVLIDQARRANDVNAVRTAFRDLRDRLHDHESRETDLIIEAFERDFGGGD